MKYLFNQTRPRDPLHTVLLVLIFGLHPQTMDLPSAKRQYSDEEKRQLIANLDIEGQFINWFEKKKSNMSLTFSCTSHSAVRGVAQRQARKLYYPSRRAGLTDT